jgi:hypothetical protein
MVWLVSGSSTGSATIGFLVEQEDLIEGTEMVLAARKLCGR